MSLAGNTHLLGVIFRQGGELHWIETENIFSLQAWRGFNENQGKERGGGIIREIVKDPFIFACIDRIP